jgi:hypothetical protein
MPVISDWRELPFEEIWSADTEFYPGVGLANGGKEGDPSNPLCLVAIEMRTGRIVKQWKGDFTPLPALSARFRFVVYFVFTQRRVWISSGARLGPAG